MQHGADAGADPENGEHDRARAVVTPARGSSTSSQHDDGVFELVPFVGKRDWISKAIRALEAVPLDEAVLEDFGLEHSKLLRASTMELEIFAPERGAPLATQIDGEERPASPRVRIEVVRQGIRLIVPES